MILQFGVKWHRQLPKYYGLLGTVVYGASRDIKGIKKLDYPVFSRAVIPNAGNPWPKEKLTFRSSVDGQQYNPGDLIIGDECGVVSVPDEII